MPTIRVEMFEGRSVEQKRALAQELTGACVRALGVAPQSVSVVFHDVAKHDWATGGILFSDPRPPQEPAR